MIDSISTGILVAFIAIAALGFLLGFKKGTFKSLTDLVFLALNVFISVLVATAVAKNVVTVDTLAQYFPEVAPSIGLDDTIINQVNGYLSSPELYSTAVALVLALATVIVLPIVFMVTFILLGIVLFIIKLIVNSVIVPSTKGIGLKLGGGLIGAVVKAVALAVLIMPIVGYANYASNTLDLLKSEDTQVESIVPIEKMVDEATETPVFKAVYSFGGKKLFDTLTTIKVNDIRISLTHETETAINLYKESDNFIGVPINEYGDKQIDSIERIEEIILDADFVPALLSNVLAYVANEWNNGNAVLGYEKPVIGTELQEALDSTITVLAQTTPSSFKQDLCTVAEIAKYAIEDGVVYALTSEDGNIMHVLENTNVISDILVELHRNERTRPILPAITNGVVNYLYSIYDGVNGTTTEQHHMVDINGLTESVVQNEGAIISNVIVELDTFMISIKEYSGRSTIDIVKFGDFAALGRAFNGIKRSYLFCDTYEFILRTVLESKGCRELGILDEQFIKNAILHDSDMEMMLVSRQKIALLVLSMYKGEELDYNDVIEALLMNITSVDADSVKNLLTEESLKAIGVKGEHVHTISGLLTSMIDTIKDESFEISSENLSKEAESASKIIQTVDSALENSAKDKNVFVSSDDKETTSQMTAGEFISTTLESEFVSSMIVIATKDESGNEVDDPYNVREHLSENDISELENALGEEYAKTEDDESKKEKLDAIAHIFGVDTSKFQ
jgi:hypothetical protein